MVFSYVAPDSPYLDPAVYRTLKERARPEFALRHEDRCTSAANTASRLQQRTAAATARRKSVHPITMAPDKSPTRAMREEALERQVIEELRRTNDVLEMMMRLFTQSELQLPARTGSEAPSSAPAHDGETIDPIGAEHMIDAENIGVAFAHGGYEVGVGGNQSTDADASVPPVTAAEITPLGTTDPNALCEASAASPVRKRARERRPYCR